MLQPAARGGAGRRRHRRDVRAGRARRRDAASDLGLNPLLFARELAQGEIGLLISYLRAAAGHVDDLDLRVRIDRLLHRLTDWTQDAE